MGCIILKHILQTRKLRHRGKLRHERLSVLDRRAGLGFKPRLCGSKASEAGKAKEGLPPTSL